jgi:hypothetical protein
MNERRNFFSTIGHGVLGFMGLAYCPLKLVAAPDPSPWCFGEFKDGELQNADQFMSAWHLQGGEGTPDGPLTRYYRFGRCIVRPNDRLNYIDRDTFQMLRVHGEVEFAQSKMVRENPTREHLHPITMTIRPNSVIENGEEKQRV